MRYNVKQYTKGESIVSESNNNKNLHQNHRARLRETFKNAGVDAMPDHNLLELLLFYSIPRKDTNELAHRLISTFGSLSRVFDADYEQLLSVEGMGESSALLLSIMPDVFRRYAEGKTKGKINLSEKEAVKDYVEKKFYGCRNEVFYMLCLDALGNLITCSKLAEGNWSKVGIEKRDVLEIALRTNACKVIFAHNHPNGVAAPSHEDLNLTADMASILRNVGIGLADHIIVGDGDFYFLSSNRKFSLLLG